MVPGYHIRAARLSTKKWKRWEEGKSGMRSVDLDAQIRRDNLGVKNSRSVNVIVE
jgi:hypothetical protein